MGQALGVSTALGLAQSAALAQAAEPAAAPASSAEMPQGKIGNLSVSRMLLGGNLLTHYTHSRDLKYVYNLAAHYNTDEKILETLAVAEEHGINTLSIHTVPQALSVLRKHRRERGGKMQWIICSTVMPDQDWEGYKRNIRELADDGTDAIYLWGVTADRLVAEGKVDWIAKAVEFAQEQGIPSGVGGHDIRVIVECEKQKVPTDFYIKTFHHHRYPSAPRPDELTATIREIPGYWCLNPDEVIACMKTVEKPWIAFKVMAAGAIPPQDAFSYAFNSGADHVLAGMFDFEIADDAALIREILPGVQRERPWRS